MTMRQNIDAAFAEANAAAASALAKYSSTAKRDGHGFILDACGFALIRLHDASDELEAGMVAAQLAFPKDPEDDGMLLTRFNIHGNTITAAEVQAQAATDVLNRLLGAHGRFVMESRMD